MIRLIDLAKSFGNRQDYRRKVGYVVDQAIFLETFSATESLSFVAKLPRKLYRTRIEELLHFLELKQEGKKRLKAYSKGMRSKVALAAAMVHHPRYLLLEEAMQARSADAVPSWSGR